MAETRRTLDCPKCGAVVETFRNPVPTVDIIIELRSGPDAGKIVLIQRRNPPLGWAIPGGFIDYGESAEQAAIREAREEVRLDVELVEQLGAYSDPSRDARLHTVSVVFIATAAGVPEAADDALAIGIFDPSGLPADLCFDHARILGDYRRWRARRENSEFPL